LTDRVEEVDGLVFMDGKETPLTGRCSLEEDTSEWKEKKKTGKKTYTG
jgi:hypothetical protein